MTSRGSALQSAAQAPRKPIDQWDRAKVMSPYDSQLELWEGQEHESSPPLIGQAVWTERRGKGEVPSLETAEVTRITTTRTSPGEGLESVLSLVFQSMAV